MKKSICIATYNGGSYILPQINSILPQINENDEVIICDDASKDHTVNILRSINDPRIKIFENVKNIGYVKNFEKAINLATGDIIFLCDQDDIWPKDRVMNMVSALKVSNKLVAAGNMLTFNDEINILSPHHVKITSKHNYSNLKNIIRMAIGKIPYFGCCMAFKREFLKIYLPFPNINISHDHWLAITGNLTNNIIHIETVVTHRRLHSNNVTSSNRPLAKKLKTRLNWIKSIAYFFAKK